MTFFTVASSWTRYKRPFFSLYDNVELLSNRYVHLWSARSAINAHLLSWVRCRLLAGRGDEASPWLRSKVFTRRGVQTTRDRYAA